MSRRRELVRLALALLVVGSVVANPLGLALVDRADPTGDARAGSVTIDCSPELVLSPTDTCDISFDDGEIEDIQDHLGIYSEATAVHAQTKGFLDLYENYAKSTEDTGWLVANNATANAYVSGLSKSETKVAVKQDVKDYYTIKELNYVNAWNNYVASLDGLLNRSDTVGSTTLGVDGQFTVNGFHEDGGFGYNHDTGNYEMTKITGLSTGTKQIELINGSETMIRTLRIDGTDSDDYISMVAGYNPITGPEIADYSYPEGGSGWSHYNNGISTGTINAQPPNNDESVFSYFYAPQWTNPYEEMVSTKDEVLNESDMFIEQTWLDWEQGNIDSQDIISQTNAMNRWQTDAATENATFNDVVAGLAASGLSTPDPSETGYLNMTFEPNNLNGNLTAQGMLLSSTPPPNGTWEIGKTYQTANLSGVQTVVALGESGATTYTVNSTSGILRVNAAYDRDGNEITDPQLSAPERTFEVTNTSDAQELLIQLGALDKELEERQASDGSTGGDDSSTSESNLWTQLVEGLGNAISGLLGALGLGGLVAGIGPVAIVGIALGVLVAGRIFLP